jgi:hypothetical protein
VCTAIVGTVDRLFRRGGRRSSSFYGADDRAAFVGEAAFFGTVICHQAGISRRYDYRLKRAQMLQ